MQAQCLVPTPVLNRTNESACGIGPSLVIPPHTPWELRKRLYHRSYTFPWLIETYLCRIISFGLVVVLRSEKDGVAVGDYLFGMTTWEAYTVQPYVEGLLIQALNFEMIRAINRSDYRSGKLQTRGMDSIYFRHGLLGSAKSSRSSRSLSMDELL